jgi:hypothetical protein
MFKLHRRSLLGENRILVHFPAVRYTSRKYIQGKNKSTSFVKYILLKTLKKVYHSLLCEFKLIPFHFYFASF